MKTDQQRQIKKQTHRLNYLKEELIDVTDTVAAGSREINLAVFEFFARSNKRIPLREEPKRQAQNVDLEDANAEQAQQDPEVKKIFRKIAVKTHPDKLDKADPDYESLTEAYINASKAAASNDFDELVQIAIDLDISIDIDYEIQIRAIEKMAQKVEKQIGDFKSGVQYAWAIAQNENIKKEMLRIFIQNLNEAPEDQLIDEIIDWIKHGASSGSSYVSRDPSRPVSIDMRRSGTRPQKRTRE